MKKLFFSLCLFCLISPDLHAFTLGIQAGPSFESGSGSSYVETPSFLVGGEAMIGLMSLFEIGAFYEQNKLNYGGNISRTLRYFGIGARVGFGPLSDFYVDGKIGLRTEFSDPVQTGLATGIGVGYRYSITPLFHFGPRLGYRIPTIRFTQLSENFSFIDLTILASVGF